MHIICMYISLSVVYEICCRRRRRILCMCRFYLERFTVYILYSIFFFFILIRSFLFLFLFLFMWMHESMYEYRETKQRYEKSIKMKAKMKQKKTCIHADMGDDWPWEFFEYLIVRWMNCVVLIVFFVLFVVVVVVEDILSESVSFLSF